MGSGEQREQPEVGGYLAALLVLALMTFSSLGALTAWRESRPTPASSVAPDAFGVPSSALATTAEGIRRAAEAGSEALARGATGEAAEALDAARRLTDVGQHGATGHARQAFDGAMSEIRNARRAIQNGDAGSAGAPLASLTSLPHAIGSDAGAAPVPTRDSWGDYAGATLLDATGAVIGEVHAIVADAAGAPRVELDIGGHRDVLGFLDLGGRRVTIPADSVVFGAARSLGPTMVVLATFAPDAIE